MGVVAALGQGARVGLSAGSTGLAHRSCCQIHYCCISLVIGFDDTGWQWLISRERLSYALDFWGTWPLLI